jgi:hypothetical protein
VKDQFFVHQVVGEGRTGAFEESQNVIVLPPTVAHLFAAVPTQAVKQVAIVTGVLSGVHDDLVPELLTQALIRVD